MPCPLTCSPRQYLFLGILVFTLFQVFSPWRIVIQRRSVSAESAVEPSDLGGSKPEVPTPDAGHAEPEEEIRIKDDIEEDFGKLEDSFLKAVGEPSNTPRRSRDHSIRLIYDAKTPNDWLDLVDGHDDNVGSTLVATIYFTG